MQHGHFTTFGLLNNLLPGIMGKDVADPGNGYEAVVQLTERFIEEAFAGKENYTKTFLERQLNTSQWIVPCIESMETKDPGG
jgi:hypothetical protein